MHGTPRDDPACSSSPFSTLPAALLARVLQHVPQQHRLGCCALVSRDWAAAATAGTLSVECENLNSSSSRCESVGAWLRKHGSQLRSIQLQTSSWWCGANRPQLQLPCSELQQLPALQLKGLQVQLLLPECSTVLPGGCGGSSSSSSTPILHMPKLQVLHLEHCDLEGTASLLQFGPFTAVTRLGLNCVRFVCDEDSSSRSGQAAAQPGTVGVTAALSRMLGAMTQLQHVQLGGWHPCGVLLAALLPSVQTLDLDTFSEEHPWGQPQPGACLPLTEFSNLGQLRELTLFGVFYPTMLGNLSQLQVLELQSCMPMSPRDGVEGEAALLSALGCFRQLRHLAIIENQIRGGHDGPNLAGVKPDSCSALTASSHLTSLEVRSLYNPPSPVGALQHMFSAGSRLPQLQELSLSCSQPDICDGTPFATGAELAALVSACPALTSLDIVSALQPGESCDALLQLPPTCRRLVVGGDGFGNSAAAVVAQLTQLTSLEWAGSNSLTDAGVYQLTALQGLQELTLSCDHCLSEELVRKEHGCMWGDLCLVDTADQPVWQQLRDKVCACPNDAAWLALLDQQQQDNRRLQQEVDRLRHVSTQQQQR